MNFNAQARSSASRWWLSKPGIVLMLAIASGAVAWWMIALPVFTFESAGRHAGHFGLTYLHAVTGTIMLFLGALNLYIGLTRTWWRFHRPVGYGYLAGGAVGAGVAGVVALANVHGATAAPFAFDLAKVDDLGFALASLSAAWLACAAMALRAARNKRFDAHRDWMIRSYVLVWAFVLCRVTGSIPGLAWIAGLGDSAAFAWLSWIVPLAIAELALQWKAGAKLVPRAR